MRPCQQCNGPVANAEKACPACGAEQQPTVGFLKSPAASTPPLDHELPSGWSDLLSRLEEQDLFDPRLVAGFCVIGVVVLLGFLFLINPVGATAVFGICSVLTAVIVGVLMGGST
ncbi:MAG: hypothetical protein KF861_11615 [Planctomycetaceae bacterium]|nr:hypothetical protein [Planctomycetaceae bacterium]